MNIGCHHLPFFVDGALAKADSPDGFRHWLTTKNARANPIRAALVASLITDFRCSYNGPKPSEYQVVGLGRAPIKVDLSIV